MPLPRHRAAVFGLTLATSAFASGLAFAAQTVHVDLMERGDGRMMIKAGAKHVGAGKVTFDVANKSRDVEHEFLIARLTVAPDKVAYDETQGKVREDALEDVHELGDIDAGRMGTMTLDLKPGKYLLFCNLPGHYKAGMYRVLEVTK